MPSSDTDTIDTSDAAPDAGREALLASLVAEFGDAIVDSHLAPGVDLTVRVNVESWADIASYLRSGLHYRWFDFLSAIDWLPSPFGRSMDAEVDNVLGLAESAEAPDAAEMQHGVAGGSTRFQVFARVFSLTDQLGVTLKADVADDNLVAPTWTGVYPGADWHEREVSEMFGIDFDGHPGLRNLYLPLEFEGHPLRKDFPLLARIVKPWPGIVDVEPMPSDDAPSTDNPEDIPS